MPVEPELRREQDCLRHAREELSRMRVKTLAMRPAGGDRIFDELLAMTLNRRAA